MNKKLIDKIFQYLCPPGNGVFTVHTAKEHKEVLHHKIYGTSNLEDVTLRWKDSFKHLESDSKPCLLGVTSDTGGGIQRGANWGPLFIRTKLNPKKYFDIGDVKTIPHLLHDKYLNEETIQSCREAIYDNNEALPVSALSITEDFCRDFYKNFPDKKLISLGGDHSVSYALVKPWLISKKSRGIKTAIIHFDAHTDLMVKRLGIDICFGSWAYHMIEHLNSPADLIQLGIRSSGQKKEYWEKSLGVQQFWAEEINNDENSHIEKIITYLKEQGTQELYVSFDIDALDASYASATGTPEKGGLQPHTCCQYISRLSEHFLITGADLVEVAPFVKSSHQTDLCPEPETTLLSSKIIIEKFLEVMS
ncbi:MAG: agmatinase [Bacteriovoracaceae bacterium]|jgi:agmatinase